MTVLVLLFAWLLSAPVVALLVSLVCRGGALTEDGWPEWPDDDQLAGGPGGPWSTASL